MEEEIKKLKMDKSIQTSKFFNHSPRFKPWAIKYVEFNKTVLTV